MTRPGTTVFAGLLFAALAAPAFAGESLVPASAPTSGEPDRPVVIGTVPNPANAPANRAVPEVGDEILTGFQQGDVAGGDGAKLKRKPAPPGKAR